MSEKVVCLSKKSIKVITITIIVILSTISFVRYLIINQIKSNAALPRCSLTQSQCVNQCLDLKYCVYCTNGNKYYCPTPIPLSLSVDPVTVAKNIYNAVETRGCRSLIYKENGKYKFQQCICRQFGFLSCEKYATNQTEKALFDLGEFIFYKIKKNNNYQCLEYISTIFDEFLGWGLTTINTQNSNRAMAGDFIWNVTRPIKITNGINNYCYYPYNTSFKFQNSDVLLFKYTNKIGNNINYDATKDHIAICVEPNQDQSDCVVCEANYWGQGMITCDRLAKNRSTLTIKGTISYPIVGVYRKTTTSGRCN